MLRPMCRHDGHFDLGENSQIAVRFDVGAAHAQIQDAPVAYGELVRRDPDWEIDLDALTPTMFHEANISRHHTAAYKSNQQN